MDHIKGFLNLFFLLDRELNFQNNIGFMGAICLQVVEPLLRKLPHHRQNPEILAKIQVLIQAKTQV